MTIVVAPRRREDATMLETVDCERCEGSGEVSPLFNPCKVWRCGDCEGEGELLRCNDCGEHYLIGEAQEGDRCHVCAEEHAA